MSGSLFSNLSFRHPFRKYQRMILAQIESGQGDHRYHLVAPPGSGKTIVGIELIRRFGAPAVVFAPTTTIQQQWQEKVGLFTPDPSEALRIASLDPTRLAPINVFTYQLISTPGESLAHVQAMAEARWVEALIAEGQAGHEAAARERLATLRENNPRAFERERARHALRLKRECLRGGDGAGDLTQFLHPNARRLIDDLVAHGVRTVVLDECHHLLDYWAIVLKHLIGRLPGARVIGLTATLPSPEDDEAFENYTGLLGDVDFEVPTPAVVKEGDLAPYRDLVYFVRPSERELEYLKGIQQAFESEIASVTASPRFRDWVRATLLERRTAGGGSQPWEDFNNQHPLLALAGGRFLLSIGESFPDDLLLPQEAAQPLALDDWAVLLERYALDVLKLSADQDDHRRLEALRRILQPFGFTLTERGLRQGRSPGDLVLTLSEAKDQAVARVLAAEFAALGPRLRAVVICDFEQLSARSRPLANVLDPDAGSAVRVFRHLVGDADAGKLNPVLVTGGTVLVDADHGAELLEGFNAFLKARGARAACEYRPTHLPDVLEVVGNGPDWSSRTYVAMVTAAFEAGRVQCLVGTRGIFGEGWDSLTLNTLIDLTSVTTSTSVQQLRGRAIRKDPGWARKVAHHWDVVCVAPSFERGDSDLRRFVKRHDRYWGIVPMSAAEQVLQDARDLLTAQGQMLGPGSGREPGERLGDPLGAEASGQIRKGVSHVSPQLAYDLAVLPFRKISFARYTRQMMAQVPNRERTHDLWGVGEEYSNFSYSATQLDGRDLKFRTVYRVEETLRRMLRSFLASMLAGLTVAFYIGARASLDAVAVGMNLICAVPVLGVALGLGALITFALNARQAYRLFKALLVDQPPDGILLDVGRAVLAALRDAELVSRHLPMEYVRVTARQEGSYEVLLDYASPEDAATFIAAYRQVFEPVRDQRYLILRDDSRLPRLWLAPLWSALRLFVRDQFGSKPVHHPVPDLLATRKERAEAFARHWQRYVGGGHLVYTRSEAGRKVLLQARGQRRPNVRGLAFEIWR